MKASVLTAPAALELKDWEIGAPGPGEVLLKVTAVGVCGSDVHYYREGAIGDARVEYPTLLGHEPSGVIEEVGEGVSLKVGDRVAVEPALPCGRCEHCLSGRSNICPHVVFLGTPPVNGIFSEFRVMPEACCIPIPKGMSLTEAALLEPLGVGLHAAQLCSVRPGDTVAILGSGRIGLVTLLACLSAGASKVFMTDAIPERLELAERMGAEKVFNIADGDVGEWIRSCTGGRGVDVTFEAAGRPESVVDAIDAARIGGRSCFIGIPSIPNLEIPFHTCRRKELAMFHCRRSNREADRCLSMVESGRLDLSHLATHHFGLEQTPQAFDMVEGYSDGVVRAMIHPHPDIVVD